MTDIAVIKVRLPEGCADMTSAQIAGVVSGYILNGLEIISIEVETETMIEPSAKGDYANER